MQLSVVVFGLVVLAAVLVKSGDARASPSKDQLPGELIEELLARYVERRNQETIQDNFYCYDWTQEDLAAMGPGRSVETERQQCESRPGRVFTQGNNKDYPNCGTCWCCQRKVHDNFHCYHWTQEDLAAMGPDRLAETERQQCESRPGRVFTQGNNADYPNCGTCWCCQRKVHDNFYCYHWTQEDLAAMGPDRLAETERQQCESSPGRVFTQGNNADYPNCGTCWCCQRKVHDNFHCYHWTQEDFAAMGPGRLAETERQQCESSPGRVFTQGNNADYPNCGTCWCCQRKVQDNFYCYHWTQADLAAMGPGRSAETEREQCENRPGRVFTQGNNKDYPNCGTCWCCQRKVYECHYWTDDDVEAMGSSRTPEVQRARCEDDLGYLFTQGNNEHFPGTGYCWCIKTKIPDASDN
ncbi:uncharacterized protein LOC123538535 isoform X3 [Mercenaria mercenaria]|uniref:uncharacterized protein LOC123538535 isoform X3 n=1 Tax=Mercenaria mercenaria TaxID=6596 RepID=UPI00234E4DFD|nr:uncharacterized protein LOC123538535 isoform X3 [Mercenaria mercenaria]